ncbi:MAG: hypothetical protein QCI38_03165, partial [Candidatus Thermoplasmatota archaeon]|nr:hypothetical protein [Candidatus Thermoplasmatota archaeon]
MKKAQALLFVGILVLSSMSLVAAPSQAQEYSKLPVAELFVYIGCHYCVYAEDAIPEVMTSTGALVLEYHIWSDQAGWKTLEGDVLASSYD